VISLFLEQIVIKYAMGKEVGLLECYNGRALVSTSILVPFKKF
jgi:hypothetical protein